jgi:hypothetical protein
MKENCAGLKFKMSGANLRGVLPKWNGARVSHPQQLGLPNERTKFHEF